MEFWKINEKAIRCIMNFDELKEQNIRLEDMLLGTENAREFLNEIIVQACLELDVRLASQQLSVHVMRLPGERIDLLISEPEENKNLIQEPSVPEAFRDSLERLCQTDQPAPAPEAIPEILNRKHLVAIYRFPTLDAVAKLCKRLASDYCKGSSLYKDPVSGCYYLCLCEKRKKFRNLTDVANEYGTLYSISPVTLSSIKEHGEAILKKSAVKHLSQL